MSAETAADRAARRLEELRVELAKGRRALAEVESERAALDAERQRLQEQLLRVSGAIRVLEELIGEVRDAEGQG